MRKLSDINYDQFFSTKSVKERREIFSEISADNRASLVKTHAKRWLAANRSRLNQEQISLAEELIQSIAPQWYEVGPGFEKPDRKADALFMKMKPVFSSEDFFQLTAPGSNYIAIVE